MLRPRVLSITVALLTIVAVSSVVHAQKAQPRTVGPAVPHPNKMAILIHSAVIALNNANLTGNYAVIRAQAAPGFQSANSPAKLAEIFRNLRKRKLDLGPTLLFKPKLTRQPAITKKGLLRLTGYFDTRPERVNFDLLFQPGGGRWRLFGISVNTTRAKPATAAAGQGMKGKTKKTARKRKRNSSTKNKTVTRSKAKLNLGKGSVPQPAATAKKTKKTRTRSRATNNQARAPLPVRKVENATAPAQPRGVAPGSEPEQLIKKHEQRAKQKAKKDGSNNWLTSIFSQ